MRFDFRPGKFVNQIRTMGRGLYWGRTTDSIPSIVFGKDVHYAVQIDVSDSTSDDNAAIGLYNDAALGGSAFRWVTDRPGYDSVTTPTGELPTANATKWAEGLITSQATLGMPIRMININVAGNYGSLSGFVFKLDNTDLLFDVIDDNEYNIINRKVRFYIILDNVFYNVWSGIVARKAHNELTLDIICEDDFKNIHKVIPPQIANETLFPNIIKKSVSKPIPVAFGQINNARLLNVQKINGAIPLNQYDSQFGDTYPEGTNAVILSASNIQDSFAVDQFTRLIVLTGAKSFTINDFVGMFLRIVMTGASDNFYEISVSSATSFNVAAGQNQCVIDINGLLVIDDLEFFTPPPGLVSESEKYSWIEIFDFETTYIVSNNEVTDYPDAETGQTAKLTFFDKDQEDFLDVSEAGETESETNILNTGFPGLTAFTNAPANNGNYKKQFTFSPNRIRFDAVTALSPATIEFNDFPAKGELCPNLTDKNRSTKYTLITEDKDSSPPSGNGVSMWIEFPEGIDFSRFDEFYVVADYDITAELTSGFDNNRGRNGMIPVSGVGFGGFDKFAQYLNGKFTAGVPFPIRLIHPSYFNEQGVADPLLRSITSQLDLGEFYTSEQVFKSYNVIHYTVTFKNSVTVPPSGSDVTLDLFEVCLAGIKNINVRDDNVYVKVIGEKFEGNPTDNVLEMFRAILRTYDGLASSDVDTLFMNSRLNWIGGRQIIDRKSSFNYLKQLAKQSFVGLYPSRLGVRTLKPYRDFSTPTANNEFSYDNGNIIEDSINSFRLGPINEVYNVFDIRYQQNVANGRFDKSVFIKKVDESAFPGQFVSTGPSLTTPVADVSDSTFTSATMVIGATGNASMIIFWIGGVPLSLIAGDTVSLDDSGGIGIVEFGTVTDVQALLITVSFDNKAGFTNGQVTATGTVWKQGTSVAQWTTFTGGFSNYATGVQLWTVCRNSYLKSLVVRELPDEYALCSWYIDEANFNGDPGENSTPFKYLQSLVEWTTRQKEIVEFEIPLTVFNVKLELLEPASFKDLKFTADELRTGYITKIKPNPAADTIILELTLIPADIESVTDCQIVESGLNTDTIVESGTEVDTIVEPGCT